MFVATCSPLSIPNGDVGYNKLPNYYFGLNNPGLTEGTTTEFFCDSGYFLSGSNSRTCTSSKTWSGQNPTCNEGNDTILSLFVVFPASIENFLFYVLKCVLLVDEYNFVKTIK